MEPVDGLTKLAQLMRRQAEKKPSAERAGTQSVPVHLRPSRAQLEQDLKTKLRQMNTSGANQSAAERVVIASMLTWEYGERLQNEPRFAALVQQVQSHIAEDADLKRALEQIVKQLYA